MDLQQLRYFIEVADSKSFTKAAEKLSVTQPMLTRTIKQIEEELDVKLIERTSKYFHLTDAGSAFYQQSSVLLMSFDDLHRNINDLKSASSGELYISTPGVLLDAYGPLLLQQFHHQYPNIKISIVEEGSKLTAKSVLSGQADIGLVMMPVSNGSQFNADIVVSSVCQLLVSKKHQFASRSVVSFKELANERIITFSETATLHDMFISMCEQQGFSPNIYYKSLMMNFTFNMVQMGLCIGVLPYPLITQKLTDDFVTVPLDPPIPWEIAAITKKGRYQSFVAKAFLTFIKSYFKNLNAQVYSVATVRNSHDVLYR